MPYGPSKSNQALNAGKTLVQFTLADAQRIGDVVAKVEGDRRDRRGSALPRAAGSTITLCQFTGAWAVGAWKTVRVASNTNATAEVMNRLYPNIAHTAGYRECLVSGDTLVAARC